MWELQGVGVEAERQDFRTASYALDSEPHERRLLVQRLRSATPQARSRYHEFLAVDKESAGKIVVHAGYTEIAGY